MKYFLRAILLSLRFKWSILASVLNALLIAVFWGASISVIYPLVEVVFEGETLHTWLDKAGTKAETRADDLRDEIRELQRQQREAPEEQRRPYAARIIICEGRLEAQEAKCQFYWSLGPKVARWAPQTSFGTLVTVMAALVVATSLKGMCLVLNQVLVTRVAAGTVNDMRRIFFRATLRMDQGRIEMIGTSHLTTMFVQHVQLVQAGLKAVYGKSVREPLKMIACLCIACFVSWQLLLVSLAIAPFGAFLIHYLGRRMKNSAAKELRGITAILQTLAETIGGIRIVKIFTNERAERRRFKGDAASLYERAMKISFYDALLRPITEQLAIATMAIAVLCGAYLVLNQETHMFGLRMSARPLSPAEMILFFAMLAGISDPARKLSDIHNVLVRACMGSQGLYRMFDQPPRVDAPGDALPMPRHSHSLRLENVRFGYVPKKPVLKGVTLEIPFGQTIAIVGTNGSGKSTLVHLLARFYDPWAGDVFVDKVNLRKVRPRQLRKQIGLVTQEPVLFRDTVWNNIQYGNLAASREQVEEAASLAGVTQFLGELPNAFDSDVGDRGMFLSGGQRQRVALARAILSDPRILILDEPTSQVDPQTELVFHQAIGKFLKGRTTILITHKASTLALADRLVVMKDGKIVEDVVVTPSTASPEQFSRLLAKAG